MVAAGSRRRRHVRSNGEFGKVERTRVLDYYDRELQFIDLEAISHWVTLARKVPDSEGRVMEKTRQAQEERSRDGWYIGIWEVNDPSGWMEFTYRPDHRYIAKSGADPIRLDRFASIAIAECLAGHASDSFGRLVSSQSRYEMLRRSSQNPRGDPGRP